MQKKLYRRAQALTRLKIFERAKEVAARYKRSAIADQMEHDEKALDIGRWDAVTNVRKFLPEKRTVPA